MNARVEHFEPAASLASARREFGEFGGVNASIESSTTFTVLEAKSMPEIFSGQKNPDNGEDAALVSLRACVQALS